MLQQTAIPVVEKPTLRLFHVKLSLPSFECPVFRWKINDEPT